MNPARLNPSLWRAEVKRSGTYKYFPPESSLRHPRFFLPLFFSPSSSLALFSSRRDGVRWRPRLLQLRFSSPPLLRRGKNDSSFASLSSFSHSFVVFFDALDFFIATDSSSVISVSLVLVSFSRIWEHIVRRSFDLDCGNDDRVGCPFLDSVLVLEF